MRVEDGPIVAYRESGNKLKYVITNRCGLFPDPMINRPFKYRIAEGGRLTIQPAEQILKSFPFTPAQHIRDWNPRGYHPSQDIKSECLISRPTDIITPN